jgi:aryl-alcohol dehydrogenase-like predicted oxidoreductase
MSRRDFLTRTSVALAGVVLTPWVSGAVKGVAGAGAAGVAASGSAAGSDAPAAAAGTLMIGGDIQVNRLGFGAMRVTGDGVWGEPRDADQARAVLRRAVELGTNFIDTADAYGPYISERLIREALYPYPRGLLIATKGGQVRPRADEWVPDGRPEHLRAACEASLTRLKLERIDLYQHHRPDPQVPYEDSIGELAKLQKEGKIRHIGISNVDPQQLAKARAIVKVVSVQNMYNIANRLSEEVLAICEREQIAFIPWAPLAQGAQAQGRNKHLLALEEIAKERHIDNNQASLAWLLAKSPVMLPIPGTSRIEHLEDNVGAAKVKLTAEEMARVG